MDNPPPPQQPEWKPGQPPPWEQPTPTPPPPAGPYSQWPPQGGPPQVPYTPMPQQPPPKRGFNLVPIIALVVIVGVIAGGFFFFRDQLAGNVTDLRVGDCFDEPASDTEISDVQHRPCNQAHDAEVFFLTSHPAAGGATYPLEDQFLDLVFEKCVPAGTTYLGADFNSRTDLDVGYFYPTLSGWNDGDRGMTCYFYKVDDSKMTASVKGTGLGGGTTPSSSP